MNGDSVGGHAFIVVMLSPPPPFLPLKQDVMLC